MNVELQINPLFLPKLKDVPRYVPHEISLPSEAEAEKIDLSRYNMDQRWASFEQVQIIQPWMSDEGENIQNVVLTSLALPPGTQHLIDEIMGVAREKTIHGKPGFARSYNDQDSLITTTEELDKAEADEGVLNVFEHLMDAAEEVIRARYPSLEYDAVTEFLQYQKLRRDSLERLKQDSKALLFSGDCKNYNAWDGEYGGFFMMKMTIRGDGSTKGLDPNGNEDNVDGHITVGELGHTEMLDDIADENSKFKGKVQLRWVADSTLYVEHCGGCTKFFEKKMSHTIFNKTDDFIESSKKLQLETDALFSDLAVFKSKSTSGGYYSQEKNNSKCSSCGKDKDGEEEKRCDCNKKDKSN